MPHRYIHGNDPGADDPVAWYDNHAYGWRRILFHDHQGSIVALADDNGAAVAINGYDAWGIPNSSNAGRFGFTGQAWIGELGMYHYKARIYSPTLGRFMQTDPVGYKDQVNLYAYVGNDPLNSRDPMGLYTTSCASFDQACNEAARRFEAARQANLRSRHADVAASARAFGNPGEDNGVRVNFLKNSDMNREHGRDIGGNVDVGGFTGSRVTMDVDMRMSLRGSSLRKVLAHEGDHVRRLNALADTYNAATGKWSAAANLTVRQYEVQGFRVESLISGRFQSASEIDRYVQENYQNLDRRYIPPEYVE